MTPSFVPGLATAILPPGQIHVWLADPDLSDPAQLEMQQAHVLSSAERARHQAYRFARDRHVYLAAHALARQVLARYTGIAPAELVFVKRGDGKPTVALPERCGAIGYNLSHTAGKVACVLGRDMECGIDVEMRRPLEDMLALAATVFSQAEVTELSGLAGCDAREQADRFFTLWTLKEAYAKATGLGLVADLAHVSFSAADGAVSARFAPSHAGDAARWHFHAKQAGTDHFLAVASLAAPGAGAPSIVQHDYLL